MQGPGYRPATMHHRHRVIGDLSCLKLLVHLHANTVLCHFASGMNALLQWNYLCLLICKLARFFSTAYGICVEVLQHSIRDLLPGFGLIYRSGS